ncbi:MAG: hypothetical protein AAF802_19075 [Planctomycetota bacterium]
MKNAIRNATKKVGTFILIAGLAVLAYGTVAFWLVQSLPPNGGANGRLPSLYVIAGGIVVVLVGFAVRGLTVDGDANASKAKHSKRIPTLYGILVLFTIVVSLFFVVSRL